MPYAVALIKLRRIETNNTNMKINSTLSSNFSTPESSFNLLKNRFAMICRCMMFFSLTLGFASGLKAQNLSEVISNLKSELSKNPDDKKRASIYSDLTWYYASVSVDSALSYGKKAISATEKLQDSVLVAQLKYTNKLV